MNTDNKNEELDYNVLNTIAAKLAVIEQKCDIILSQLSGLRTNERLDELINRLHDTAKSMRND